MSQFRFRFRFFFPVSSFVFVFGWRSKKNAGKSFFLSEIHCSNTHDLQLIQRIPCRTQGVGGSD